MAFRSPLRVGKVIGAFFYALGPIAILNGCASPQVRAAVHKHIPEPDPIVITATTNFMGPDYLSCAVYGMDGKSHDHYAPYNWQGKDQNGKPARYEFYDLPEGDYWCILKVEGALRRVVKVRYAPNAPTYDFSLAFGDTDRDDDIDLNDLAYIRHCMGITKFDHEKWNWTDNTYRHVQAIDLDFDNNGRIDERDLEIARANLGRKSDPLPLNVDDGSARSHETKSLQ